MKMRPPLTKECLFKEKRAVAISAPLNCSGALFHIASSPVVGIQQGDISLRGFAPKACVGPESRRLEAGPFKIKMETHESRKKILE